MSKKQPIRVHGKIDLKRFDPGHTGGLDKQESRVRTALYCERVAELQELLYANADRSVLIVLQGMDTSGKDGAGKRLLEYVTPAGVETTNFKAPSSEERAHDFLWRVHKAVPRHGNIGVFNRSHYEEVLIARVLNLVPEKVWRRRYSQINDFEKILTDNGVVLLKFFLHISKEEQAERLRARINDPRKNWKFQKDDLVMRKHWGHFQEAYEDALSHCSPDHAPWHIVPADHKWYRDHVIAKTVAEAMEELRLSWPEPKEDLSKIRIV